jgi:hypothetical protein
MELTESKRRSVSDNPSVRAQRDAEWARQVEANRLESLRERRSREWSALVSQHRAASERLRHDQQVERDHHSQFASQPAGAVRHAEAEKNVSDEDLSAIYDGKKFIFVWGRWEYIDAFGEKRFFEFCDWNRKSIPDAKTRRWYFGASKKPQKGN